MRKTLLHLAALIAAVTVAACGAKKAAVATPQPPPPDSASSTPAVPPTPPAPRPPAASAESVGTNTPILSDDLVDERTLEDLNRDSPLQPAFFLLDSAELDERGRTAVAANAEILKKNPRWVITIEGHCDERGTAEYNLALGERRALAAKNYLISLGIAEARVKTVSYGDEFPFDRGHDDAAWAQNRRAHFVIAAK